MSMLKERPKEKWKSSHLWEPFPDNVVEAMLETGHFTRNEWQQGKLHIYVTIANYDEESLALKVTFSYWMETTRFRREHPDLGSDAHLKHWFIIKVPMDPELGIDTTSED